MSYCRFGWDGNQAYIFGTTLGPRDTGQHVFECCGCWLGDNWYFETYGDMLRHLNDHRTAGHYISDYVDERLWEEVDSTDPEDRWDIPLGDLPDRAAMVPNPPAPEEAEAFKRYKARMRAIEEQINNEDNERANGDPSSG